MARKTIYEDLERRIKQLEFEILEYQRKNREERNLINAIAERIAKFIEREWAEDEIRKHRNRDDSR